MPAKSPIRVSFTSPFSAMSSVVQQQPKTAEEQNLELFNKTKQDLQKKAANIVPLPTISNDKINSAAKSTYEQLIKTPWALEDPMSRDKIIGIGLKNQLFSGDDAYKFAEQSLMSRVDANRLQQQLTTPQTSVFGRPTKVGLYYLSDAQKTELSNLSKQINDKYVQANNTLNSLVSGISTPVVEAFNQSPELTEWGLLVNSARALNAKDDSDKYYKTLDDMQKLYSERQTNPQKYYTELANIGAETIAMGAYGTASAGFGPDENRIKATQEALQKVFPSISKYIPEDKFSSLIQSKLDSQKQAVSQYYERLYPTRKDTWLDKAWKVAAPIANVAASAAAFTLGGPPAAAAWNGANSYMQGAKLEDALRNAATSYASQVVGNYVGVNTGSQLAGSLASGATAGAISGNFDAAIKNALTNYAGNVAGQTVGGGAPGTVVSSAVSTLLSGGNIEDALKNSLARYAINTGMSYMKTADGRLVDSNGKEASAEVVKDILADAQADLIHNTALDKEGNTLESILTTAKDILEAPERQGTQIASADTGTMTDAEQPLRINITGVGNVLPEDVTGGPSLADLVAEQQAQDPFYTQPEYDWTKDLTPTFQTPDIKPPTFQVPSLSDLVNQQQAQDPFYTPPSYDYTKDLTPTFEQPSLGDMVTEQQAQDPFYIPPTYSATTDLTPTFVEKDLLDLVTEQQAQDPFYVPPTYDDTTDLTPTFQDKDLIDMVREQQAEDPFYVEPEYDDTTDLTPIFGGGTTGGGGLPSGGGGGGGGTSSGGTRPTTPTGGLPSAPATDPFAQLKPLSIARADMEDIRAYNPLAGATWGQAINMPTPTFFSPQSQPSYFDASQLQDTEQYAEGGIVEHNPEFFSEGGASLANRYVKGDGDGTSDSVPAMLASGEFVIPADVVSALGNGDNDAGAGVLDKFLAVIRNHKRDAHEDDLPPDSKGPLTYIAEAQKRAHHGRT